ncbi:MAG: aminotransferase class I/II-fold pyridoxal phosphate-dependent enzyme [Candidatus Eremiobacterota bacterium]
MDQTRTPYFDALLDYVEKGTLSFHCPGHKAGRGMHEKFKKHVGLQGLAFDLTEVLGLDDLHHPTGVLKEAQELAAEAYGAEKTFFLINGSTSGNQAMIFGIANPGEQIIIPRNAHKSTISAFIISGAIPVFMEPVYDKFYFLDHNVTVDTVKDALKKYPQAKAVLIVSPTYYGATADLENIIKLVHDSGKIALVDEAWGPHLKFHPALPKTALECGADIVVNSTHKLIGGMSQGAMLHLQGNRINYARVASAVRFFTSTSPSCLIVASLDMARMQMATEGEKLLSETIQHAEYARERIKNIEPLFTFGKELIGTPGVFGFDPTKLTVDCSDTGYSGYELNRILRYEYGVQIELQQLFHVLALITIGNSREDIVKLVNSIEDIVRKKIQNTGESLLNRVEKRLGRNFEMPDWPQRHMSPREAFISDSEMVPTEKATGRVSADMITPYPPGIPAICPGEIITDQIIDYLQIEYSWGAHIQGLTDPELKMMRVVK